MFLPFAHAAERMREIFLSNLDSAKNRFHTALHHARLFLQIQRLRSDNALR